ncbi:MAG: radical SAM protein [Deltaproteobacteria bacterium]|nr:radical SAM protein [Deltaproteobacteria bacterium]
MNPFKIKRLVSGGIITNYFCTSRCGHCLYNAGPYRKKQYIDPDIGEENLRVVRRMGCTSVHIGGGEPLLRPHELGKILEIAAHVGVSIEYVETNASWFEDLDSAKNILSELRRKGLRTLLVSISPFHNEFIPFSRTRGVMEAARMAGVGVFPWTTDFISDLSQFDPERTHTLDAYEIKFGKGYLRQVLERYWVHMGGRALETFRPILPNRSPRQILDAHPEGCAKELSDTTHFHIDLFGNYIPGLCTGLSISTTDLDKPLSENKYPIVTTLAHSGIRGIGELAQKELGYVPIRNGYINKCDLCMEIRSFLVDHKFGGESELNPKEFYSSSHPNPDISRP